MWEGGARVPCVMRWPKEIRDTRVISNIASTIDILPTIADIIDDSKIGNKIDGVSILPLFPGTKLKSKG